MRRFGPDWEQSPHSARDRICSLYVFIGEHDDWGHSFGRDAILAILGWGFETFDLHMVELWGLSENERAIRTYRACGFISDGVWNSTTVCFPACRTV